MMSPYSEYKEQTELQGRFIRDHSRNVTTITEDSVIVPMGDYLRMLTDSLHLRELEQKGVDIHGFKDEPKEI